MLVFQEIKHSLGVTTIIEPNMGYICFVIDEHYARAYVFS